jgi:long-subunit fatty acid transport protein
MFQLDSVHRFVNPALRLLGVLVFGPLFLTATMSNPAHAGGLYVNECSTTSQANADAGRGAWVPDASATLHNPASMTQLDDHGFATGLSYDTSGLRNTDRTTALPLDEQIRFAVGAQHHLNESLTLGLSFVYVNLGQGEVRNATVRGDYDRNNLFVFGMTVAFKELPWSGKATYTGKEI